MKVRVYSHTTVHNGEESYRLAIVESERGERRTVRLADAEIQIGDWIDLPADEAAAGTPEPGDASS